MREQKKKKDRAALALVLCFCVVALTSVFAVKSSLNKINAERTNREFDTSFSIVKTRHIEITPLAVNFFVKFYDFVSACRCSL